jgi:membrane associated rhomboid family serine protease
MGIHDREYYRRDGPSFLGSLTESGAVCKWLVGINVLCFFVQMLSRDPITRQEPFTNALILDGNAVLHGQVWRLLTGAFLHSTQSFLHIIFNMLLLWWFGRHVEDHLGSREFLAFYLVSAVVGNLIFMATASVGLHGDRALGASGAVTAVLVLSACYNPRQVILLFFVIPIPIWGFVIFMVAKDTFTLLGKVNNGIGAAAHLGGAAFGFVYYSQGWRLLGPWFAKGSSRRRRSKPRLRVYREDDEPPTPVSVAAASSPVEDKEGRDLVAQMDAILEKISRVGKDKLTDSERELLLRASEVFKRRRR